ncbi:MAG: hypothetical protein KC535_00880 [Nanoarchaeota archaeon]|nr:hypothetical protein [Nanoarchaeota archaeon]
MKKLGQLLVILALVLSVTIVPVFAEDNETTGVNTTAEVNTTVTVDDTEVNVTVDVNATVQVDDNEDDDLVTEDDLALFQTAQGAQMRLLQLERAIVRQINLADQIIAGVENSSDLEQIRDEMDALLADVITAKDSVTEANSETALAYVEMRQTATDLSQSFRITLMDVATADELAALRGSLEIDEETQAEMDDLTEQIDQLRDEHNALRLEALFGRLGISDEALMERVRNGEATIGEVRSSVRTGYQNLSAQEKRVAAQQFVEHRVKVNVARNAVEDQVRENIEERIQNRRDLIEERSEVLKTRLSEAVQARANITQQRTDIKEDRQQIIQDRKEIVDSRKDIIQNRAEIRGVLS